MKMLQITYKNATIYIKLLLRTYNKVYNTVRYSHNWSSKNVRKHFLDYFIKENDHNFIRSSPIVPFCDPTVAFVNAGMNQFKSIFLGRQEPSSVRVANSQKCVRVGGKHNDLNIVGTDGYHHTFFEMLGNWSFGDYFKKEACELAWKLLTGPYNINPLNLYVTYFAGDKNINLEPDLECREIWRMIGVSDDRILPFDSKDNFWEMGLTGPCGPCTEIHIDHTGSGKNRAVDVNKNLSDLTELWNIVFIQYNRDEKNNITVLPKKHIDTGMGLERLTAVLQGTSSNYDTDLFTNLFDIIEKNCKNIEKYSGKYGKDDQNNLDMAYRILADHSRMITVCLSDGMIPEENQKLRKILRKCFNLTETVFKKDKELLNDLSYGVAESLGESYPEIFKNIKQVKEIINYESEIYNAIRKTASKDWQKIVQKDTRLKNFNVTETPGLISAYNDLISSEVTSINSETAFKLYDTHGLDSDTITQLSEALNLKFETKDLENELENAKKRTKEQYKLNDSLINITKLFKTEFTDDHPKYDYEIVNNKYSFKPLEVEIKYIINENKIVDNLPTNDESYLVLNKTNLYTESGGQISDIGQIEFPNGTFTVTDVFNINNYIFHKGRSDINLKVGDIGKLSVDSQRRVNLMSNHTATHLLNGSIKNVINATTCQKSSLVTPEYLNFDVGIYSKKLSMDDIEEIENNIIKIIQNKLKVDISLINSQELLKLDNVTLIPGEIYPDDGIRLIKIIDNDFVSIEPCCGTHVQNTYDLEDFCIINYKSLGRSTATLTAVTGDRAKLAHKNGIETLEIVRKIEENDEKDFKDVDERISELKHKLIHDLSEDEILPIYIKNKCVEILDETSRKLRSLEREQIKDLISLEMQSILDSNLVKSKKNKKFIVHYLECSCILENVPLQQATKVCGDIPTLVLSYSESMVKARCCVPKSYVKDNFNAELWLKQTADVFKGTFSAPKGQDGKLVCNMKAKKIKTKHWDSLLSRALRLAKRFANNNL